MEIIEAATRDIPAIQPIYAYHVLQAFATFETEPPNEADMAILTLHITDTLWQGDVTLSESTQ